LCAGEGGLEQDVFVQVMAAGDVLEIGEHLRLVDVVGVPRVGAEVFGIP
jgi:hypothetical protein